MKLFSLFLITLAVASAEVILNGACPAVQPVQNFDLNAYAGTWYHIKKVPTIKEGNASCETTCYTVSGTILKITSSQIINGVNEYIVGIVHKANENDSAGKLIYNLNIEQDTIVTPLWVLDTDYQNYAISYTCKNNEASNTHTMSIWVNSRTKDFRNEVRGYVDSFINRNFGYIDASNFYHVNPSEQTCKFHTSRVYAYANHRH